MRPTLFHAAALAALLAGCARTTDQPSPAAEPPVVQVVRGLNNPESCALSPDARWLYVTNCASGEFGPDKRVAMVRGEGAISRLRIAADGRLEPDDLRFVTGLDSPLGIVAAPRAVGPHPPGTLFVCVGNALLAGPDGTAISDPGALGTAVLAIDPASGAIRARIPLGVGSAVAAALGHPLLLPNGIAVDGEGALLIADSGAGGDRLQPPVPAVPGILRLALDDRGLVAGQRFTPVPGGPNGVHWDPLGKATLWVTCGDPDPGRGALVRDGRTAADGLGPCDGIAITRAGTVLVSRFAGDLVAIRPGRAPEALPLRFAFPSDIRLLTTAGGTELLLVPEQEAWGAQPWSQNLRVVRLPPGF